MDTIGILILALIWGSSFLFIKIGLNGGMPPLLVAGSAKVPKVPLFRRLR